MVKRNPPRKGRGSSGIELFMECTDEALSGSQITAQQIARFQYDQALAKIRDAQAKARIGKAKIINKVDVGKVIPQAIPKTLATQPSNQPGLNSVPALFDPERPSSPDIIFVGESPAPPTAKPSVSAQSISAPPVSAPPVSAPPTIQQQQQPQPRHLVITSRSPTQNPALNQQHVYKLVNIPQQFSAQWLVKPVANVMPQQQQAVDKPVTQDTGVKRPSTFHDQSTKKKIRTSDSKKVTENDESDNWVPLDEYYYGKMEGDPTYYEEKNEYRFKCWYCNKMLYNNVKAMMHIQGHIDSSKQQNIDLSDLTQCKHCYKQFDTPFEMQTHVDKVHMSNSNVLLCRICDRDHDTHQALMTHMRGNHKACEMPYTCQLCKFRSSMYSDVVDHFKKKHDSSQHLMCLYCLRIFNVKFVSQGWGTTQTYYGHILKHQSKAQNKKCGLCRLSFFNGAEVKAHKQKHHGANHKAVLGTAAHTSKPDQLLIKVPSSQKNSLKSLNAPTVSKVMDFGGTTFPSIVHYYNCYECKMSMGTHDHYRKYVECSMCRFATICSIAYANHMMGFHSGQMSSLNLNIPWERKMQKTMYCLCGFSSQYGNKIANHLVFCMKSTCYENKPDPGAYIEDWKEREMVDPRTKADASLLDALGLVQKRNVTPRSGDGVYSRSYDSSPMVTKTKMADRDYEPSEDSQDAKISSRRSSDISDDAETKPSHKPKPALSHTSKTMLKGEGQTSKKTEKELLDFDNEDSSEAMLDDGKIGDIIDSLDEDRLLNDDSNEGVKGSSGNIEDQGSSISDDTEVKGSSISDDTEVKGSSISDDTDMKECSISGDTDAKDSIISHEAHDEEAQDPPEETDEAEKDKTAEVENNSEKSDNENSTENSEIMDVDENSIFDKDNVDNSENENIDQKDNSDESPSDDLLLKGEGETDEPDIKTDEDELLNEGEVKEQTEEETGERENKENVMEEENVVEKELEGNLDEQIQDEKTVNVQSESEDCVQTEGTNNKHDSSEQIEEQLEDRSGDCHVTGDDQSKQDIDDDVQTQNETESNSAWRENVSGDDRDITRSSSNKEDNSLIHQKTTNSRGHNSSHEETSKSRGVYSSQEETSKSRGDYSSPEAPSKSRGDYSTQEETSKSRGDYSSSQRESPSKSYHSKDSHHYNDRRNDRDRGYHDDRNYHRNKSYDDRRSHDRRSHHYDDRSYHHGGRQDDRNRHGGRNDRDRSYHDNRGYDRRDYRHDDRRRGQGHYQGQGYGGGYHGYR